jgi:hypothetical protein
MRDFGPYRGFGDSELSYVQERRRRAWAMSGRNGLQGYAAFLAGADIGPETGGVVAAELSAVGNSDWLRPIFIGVATSACAFLVNRWLGRVFK